MELKPYKNWLFTGSCIHNLPDTGLYHNLDDGSTTYRITPFSEGGARDIYREYRGLFNPRRAAKVYHPVIGMYFQFDGKEWREMDEF